MRLISFFLLLLPLNFLSFVWQSPQENITWIKWEDAYEKAIAENKMVLLEVVTTVCPYCVKMDKETYTSPKIIDMVNKNFYACKVNPKDETIKYKYKDQTLTASELINMLTLNSQNEEINKFVYPTTIFYLPNEEKTFVEPGFQPPDVYVYMLYNCIKYKERLDKKKK
ncbi:MAG TPA: DUF255 domain-containing protein [Bacteroidia bacterium]|nr:DUF255 domain-containing protein [Bacteroidia bacterium]HRS58710.1 DUF255 domain-containing protein [Bacteroidia bacterium]HRU68367.1 DUF255 domain-containing protein [Bacteroidia bacterium]